MRRSRSRPPATETDTPADGTGAEQMYDERYLRLLMWLLISVTFFEGYDEAVLSLVAPQVQDEFGVDEATLGFAHGAIQSGLFFAFFLTRSADRYGRRSLLIWTVMGYTLTTAATAFSPDLATFTALQFASRLFLGAQYAVAITMIVEEFPPGRRASALGKLLMCNALGILTVGLLVGAGAGSTSLGWRLLFLLGVAPLLAVGYYRRELRETRPFVQARSAGRVPERQPLMAIWHSPYNRRLLLVGSVSLLRAVPLFASIAWFAFYVTRERGYSDTVLSVIFVTAFAVGLLGYRLCGSLMDQWGRRPTAMLYLTGTAVFGSAVYLSEPAPLIGLGLVGMVFFGLGAEPLFGAMSVELFPTELRNTAAAWSRNVFQIAGIVLGPVVVGLLGDSDTGPIGRVGPSVAATFVLLLPAAWLVWKYLPETRGMPLDETAALALNGAGGSPQPLSGI